MVRWSIPLQLQATLLAASGCDLFHATSWSTLCDREPTQAGCANVAGAGGTGGGGAGGDGGSGGVVRDGTSPERAGSSCQELLQAGHATGDGSYWIDADAGGAAEAFLAFCDMALGGWTLAGVVSADDAAGWSELDRWSDADTFGSLEDATAFAVDMKSPAWSTLAVTQLRLESATGGVKTSGSVEYASLSALFAEPTLVSLKGVESGWTYPMQDDKTFFAEIQNPPTTGGTNRSPRNRCILAMGYDDYINAAGVQDDQVHGFGCTEGTGAGSGPCFNESCGDVIRDASLRVYVR